MKKIAVFTGTRAEYGLLYGILNKTEADPDLCLQLFAGGMHLSQKFGMTINQIIEDGFEITETLDFLLSSDSAVAISQSMALAQIGAAKAFERHKPDAIIILGDRFEALAVAQAAMIACVPIFHIHGGEKTEGLIDEAIRHAITKMSHLHFTSTETYRTRVIQLGEQPERVFNTGAPGLDNIRQLSLLSREEVSEKLGLNAEKPYFFVTFHPVTLQEDGGVQAFQNLLSVLEKYNDYDVIISFPNADAMGQRLVDMIESFVTDNAERAHIFPSLGQLLYLSTVQHCACVIGNSSSGLIEAPSLHVPTINIGDRQKGRIAPPSVISCGDCKEDIAQAIEQSLSKEHKEICANMTNPYGDGHAAEKIIEVIKSATYGDLLQKEFYDL